MRACLFTLRVLCSFVELSCPCADGATNKVMVTQRPGDSRLRNPVWTSGP